MAAPTDRRPLVDARTALSAARTQLVAALYDADLKQKALESARRLYAPDTEELRNAENAKLAADDLLLTRQELELQRRVELHQALGAWLAATAAEDIARLEAAAPIVLFPVRIETKFDLTSTPKTLRIRVYPDTISLNTHETALTDEEYEAAVDYYTRLAHDEPEKNLWRELVARFGSTRAAYVLREMLPTFDGPPWASCATTTISEIDDSLHFPNDIQRRPATWSRPGEVVLPDRWIFVFYRGADRKTVLGNAIPEPLAITLDPNLPSSHLHDVSTRGFRIDDNLRWTVDYDLAVQNGMAYSLALTDDEARDGFDKLIVYGVKSSLPALEVSELVENVLNGHHYTRGLAILPQGSATNNTEDRRTPYPVKDDGGSVSFGIERDPPPHQRHNSHHCPPFDDDATAMMMLLGCPNGTVRQVEGSDRYEQKRAATMNRVLWGATLGYFMEQMMRPVFSRDDISRAQDYFQRYVRGRGPSPAFRVGQVPYGVLPVVSLKHWQRRNSTSSEEELEASLVDELRILVSSWKTATDQVPRIKRDSKDPHAELLLALSVTPSSRQFRVRNSYGEVTRYHRYAFLKLPYEPIRQATRQAVEDLFRRLRHSDWNPRIGHLKFEKSALLLDLPLVTAEAQASALPSPNYILQLRNATWEQLRSYQGQDYPGILYFLFLRSLLYEYARLTNREIERVDPRDVWREREIVKRPSRLETIWDRFARVIPSVSSDPLGKWARDSSGAFLSDLTDLSSVEVPELERLASETLDVVSHRVDAWATALATRRILETRSRQVTQYMKPVGSHLGGYGWVEDLRPISRIFRNVPGAGQLEVKAQNGGYVHAPSMAQASTAAILRNAYLSHQHEDARKFAIDLSSQKTRLGRELVNEMLNGQTLGAVLGYRFERGLRERHTSLNPQDRIRWQAALRRLYPLVAKKTGAAADTSEPTEAIAAENVVDGKRLLDAYRDKAIVWGSGGLPANGSEGQLAIQAEIEALVNQADAVADLMLAESLHHLLQRNVDRSLAASRAPVRGERPVDPHIATSPRTGSGVTHRVALVLTDGGATPDPAGWGDIAATPRSVAEPALDAWVGTLLGDPEQVRATVLTSAGSTTVTLKALGLRPLDVLALAEPDARAQQGAVLDERILVAAFGDTVPAAARIQHVSDPIRAYRTFPEILEVARAVSAVLSGSKELWLDDLLSPAESETASDTYATSAAAAADDTVSRANAARTALAAAGTALGNLIEEIGDGPATETQAAALRDTLRTQAAAYLPGSAFARAGLAGSDVLTLAVSVFQQLERRRETADAINTSTGTDQERFRAAKAKLRAILGSGFAVTASFAPPGISELQQSLDARTELLGSDELVISQFLTRVARVRERLGRFRQVNLYADALGMSPLRQDVVQLPHRPGDRWLGRSLASGQVPARGQLSLVLLSPGATAPDPENAWRGFVLDDWVELIASKDEETGITFHYDSPGTDAPNCILVAAPAKAAASWDEEQLLDTIEQTFAMVKVRAVDGYMHSFGQLLPTTLMARNTKLTTVSVNLADSLVNATTQAFQALIPRK